MTSVRAAMVFAVLTKTAILFLVLTEPHHMKPCICHSQNCK